MSRCTNRHSILLLFYAARCLIRAAFSFLAVSTLILQQFLFIGSAYADLPIAADGTTNTQVTKTASGIDQINIAAPNSSGLSHNKFSEYNINESGQIINNFSGSPNDLTKTQIGGLVTTNPNLNSSGSANIILNEVTGNNITQMRGYAEIAGKQADLIISNPNGLTCNGCGFINVSRLGMIVGRSEFDAEGSLGFNLTESQLSSDSSSLVPLITISGLGLDATNTSATDIIASSVKLIGNIYGSNSTDLTIKTGDGRYNHKTKEITSQESSITNDTPLFAIDAANLSKIQSGRIFLIATKEGLGVNMPAEIIAGDKIQIDANGDIYYAKLNAANEVSLRSTQNTKSLSSLSEIKAPLINIESNQLNNSGAILADEANLKVSQLNNLGEIKALDLSIISNSSQNSLIDNQNLIYGQDSLSITGVNLINSAMIFSPQDYSISLSGFLDNSGLIRSDKNLQISSLPLKNSGTIYSSLGITLNATDLNNSGIIQADLDLILSLNALNNSGSIQSIGDSSINLTGGDFLNSDEALIYSGSNLAINSNSAITNKGKIITTKDLGITANSMDNRGNLISLVQLNLDAESVTNSGLIQSLDNQQISVNELTNSGIIYSANNQNFLTSNLINSGIIQSLNNQLITSLDVTNSGELSSQNNLSIDSTTISNSGQLIAANNLQIDSSESLTNEALIQSNNKLNISSNSGVLINSGIIKSLFTSEIKAKSITNNIDGVIYAKDNSNIAADGFFANLGAIIADSNLELSLAAINSTDLNNDGTIYSSGEILITLNNLLANQGSISSGDILEIVSANSSDNSALTNTASGQLVSADDLSINLSQGLTNQGSIKSIGVSSLSAKNLNNSGSILIENSLSLNANSAIANSGNISGNKDISITATTFTNEGTKSLILAGNDLTINATSISNQNTKPSNSNISSGLVSANGNIILNADSFNNNFGIVSAKAINLDSSLSNNNGIFLATANIILDLGNLNHTLTGNITANDIEIIASNIINQADVSANNHIKLTATGNNGTNGTITNGYSNQDNSNIKLTAATTIELIAKGDVNNYGLIKANDDIEITSNASNINNSGQIQSGSDVSLNASNGSVNNLNNDSSLITAENNITINTKNLSNSGEISAANNITTNITNDLNNNKDALIWSGNDSKFNVANNFINNQGAIYANNNLTIQKNDLTDSNLNKTNLIQNISGTIETFEGDLSIKAGSLENKRSSMKVQNYVYWQSGCNYHNHECHYDSSYKASFSGTVGSNSKIASGKDLDIDSNSLTNNL